MKKKAWALLLCLVSLFISSCAPPPSPCAPSIEWNPKWSSDPNGPPYQIKKLASDGPSYIDREVIVVGYETDARQVLSALGLTSNIADSFVVHPDISVSLQILPPSKDGSHMAFYLLNNVPITAKITQIYTQSVKSNVEVFADFNYLTGEPDRIAGNPNSVGAHPFGQPVIAGAAAQGFAQQWAFQASNGINLFDSTGKRTIYNEAPSPVRVAVFDTSPFGTDPVPQSIAIPMKIPNESDSMPLCVSNLQSDQDFSDDSKVDISSHGLFVAGLVHAVAPSADIHLVRVLNNQGVGALYWLIKAMVEFMEPYKLHDPNTPLVYNLSLGLEKNAGKIKQAFNDDEWKYVKEFWDKYEKNGQYKYKSILESLPSSAVPTDTIPIVTLEAATRIVQSQGVMVVAAAGNDSKGVAPHLPAHIPAAYKYVESVAASNQNGDLSCYSNLGKVKAPGGDVKVAAQGGDMEVSYGCDAQGAGDTLNNSEICNGSNCPYAVMSIVKGPIKDATGSCNANEYCYAYWMGTSFATPLATGFDAEFLSCYRSPTEPRNSYYAWGNTIDLNSLHGVENCR